jgi:UDP-N-acetylmuramoyl-L-alanyl-D-glutamate--2,6-diaminopimelate ligase
MVEAGMEIVVMETASQGFKLQRTAGILFDIGIFTNLSPDHIGANEHADFAEYLSCKKKLFEQCRLGYVNADDEHWQAVTAGGSCEITSYGIKSVADLCASDLSLYRDKGSLGIRFHIDGKEPSAIAMPGTFSVYNALPAILVGRHFAVPLELANRALANIHVKGRIEMIPVSDEFTLMIDYAHNALGLESLLKSLREYQPKRLVCLFGCGGNRDRERRFRMGETSGRLADFSIVTSDNPRYEEPQAIIEDIKTGIARTAGEYVEIPDRRQAIAYAIEQGRPGDIIVLAGKGHEDYQEIKGVKYAMDEREIINDILKNRSTPLR